MINGTRLLFSTFELAIAGLLVIRTFLIPINNKENKIVKELKNIFPIS